ncbi:uncharacterized protein [Venturia canescens]|uniref:uncharacterized protein n=1 Tax=Venturia canescens TaxID=32260 RepID=UPI001C9C2225|nr:uncharacterized protein LOC122416436 [Venturia canescens]
MGDIEMGLDSVTMSETPHGTMNTSSRVSHNSYDSNGDSGYLTLTPRSGGFTPIVGGCRSRTAHVSKPYRLRGDVRQSERAPRLRSRLNSLINATSDQGFDSLIAESPDLSTAGNSHDSGIFSSERPDSSRNERSYDSQGISNRFQPDSSYFQPKDAHFLPGAHFPSNSAHFQASSNEAREASAELRERRSRTRRAWRTTAAPATPASRLQLLSPPPSPALPSTSFIASEPIEEDVEMKLVVPQSTPYTENPPNKCPEISIDYCSPKRSVAKLGDSVDNKRLSKLAITELGSIIPDIKPKRLDFSQRAFSHALHRTRATPDFTGKATLDIITLLGEKSNHWRVVSKILADLSPQDLCSFTLVSKAWRRICTNDSRANMRRLSHIILRQNTKENLKLLRKAKLDSGVPSSPKSRYVRKGFLLEVQNFLQTPTAPRPPNSPPVSPSKVKFHSFVKASRTLEPWEHLLPCPNCSFPCHVDDEKNVGKCSRQGCSMEFCTSCSSRPHTGPCKTPLLATPTKRNKRLVVGSRQSKRNLRRL